MKESQEPIFPPESPAASNEISEDSDEPKRPNFPPENISSIIQRSAFGEAAGLLATEQTLKADKPLNKSVESAKVRSEEVVKDKVVEAANANAALELAFELRHEFKDQPAKDLRQSGSKTSYQAPPRKDAPPISPLLRSIINPTTRPAKSTAPTKTTSVKKPVSLYKKAILSGLVVALVLVLIFVITIILT